MIRDNSLTTMFRLTVFTVLLLQLSACVTTNGTTNGSMNEALNAITTVAGQDKTDSRITLPLPDSAAQTTGWHNVGFRIARPEGEEPSWYMDVYLAHQVIKPVLEQYRQKIVLWRFHRRAALDATGHQFSFIFYTTADVAEQIFGMIRNDRGVSNISNAGIINSIHYSDSANIGRPRIEDTSDKSWSVPVQKTWPWFIMGVSEMWLRLIDELAGETQTGPDSSDYQGMLNDYASISSNLDKVWRIEGSHALLHHLNAMYGYNETIVTERKLTRF